MKNLYRTIKFYFNDVKFEFGGGYKVFVKDAILRTKRNWGIFFELDEKYQEWLKENTKGRFCFERMHTPLCCDINITFAQKSEAMYFKLVWGGK
jgi:hypothetical protein